MALTTQQQAIKLFKKLMGVSDTINPWYATDNISTTAKEFFNEGLISRQSILPSQVWQDADSIPAVAPSGMVANEIRGVVQYIVDLPLTQVLGSTTAFSNSILKGAIPFNFDSGMSYNYVIKNNINGVISFGDGNWVVDSDAGVLNFYSAVTPSNMPPKISFYKYVGKYGVGSGVETIISYNSGSSTLTVSGTTTTTIDLSTLVQQVASGFSDLVAITTTSGLTGDGNKANDISLPLNLVIGSPVRIVINGIEVNCGAESTSDCFFAIDNGVTQLFSNARASGSEQPGDKLYWRDTAIFQLENDDEIDMVFLINK